MATQTKAQIIEGLDSIGAVFATRTDKYIDPNDPMGSKPAYHVHPDRREPWQNAILRFYGLSEIASYIAARQEAAKNPEAAEEIMGAYWETMQA
jgi:hypothetical protein